MAKEIVSSAGTSGLRLEPSFTERLALLVTDLHFKTGGMFNRRQRRYFHQMALSILRDEERSMATDAKNLFNQDNLVIHGKENIPPTGSVLVVGNHQKLGPLRGAWIGFQTAKAFFEVREERDPNPLKAVIQGGSQFQTGFFDFEPPLIPEMVDKVARAYDMIDVEPCNKGAKTPAMAIVRSFRMGKAILLFPEGEASYDLHRGKKEVGRLIEILARVHPSGKVLPFGAFKAGERMFLRFGQGLPIEDIAWGFQSDRARADFVMRQIASLLPPKFRGYYSKRSRNAAT